MIDALRRRWRPVVAIIAALALSVGVGSTYALWKDADSQPGGVILNGNLRLSGESVAWAETNPNVPEASRLSGSDLASLKTFIGAPGDEVEVRYPVVSTLVGDNIEAVLRVAAASTPALPAGVELAGYRLRDGSGAVVAPTAAGGVVGLGTAVQPDALQGPGTFSITVCVVIRWTGSVQYTSQFSPADDPQLAAVPPVTISLEQTR